MYHLILDRKVAEELAEVKKHLNAPATPSPSTPSTSPLKIQPHAKPGIPHKLSILLSSIFVSYGKD
jgi:hypothetical protein